MRKLIMTTVGVAIAVIITAAVLMPVLEDSMATSDTFTNEGYFRLKEITADEDLTTTIEWSSSVANILKVNGVDVDISTFGLPTGYASITIVATENDIIRIGANNQGTSLNWVQIRGSTYAYSGASTNFTATITNGTISAVMDESSKTATYDSAYVIDETNTGAYVMKKANTPAYMKSDSEYYAMGVTNITGGYYITKLVGDLESVEISILAYAPDTLDNPTASNESINYADVGGHVDLHTLTSITFDVTEGENVTAITYSYFIVPYEVTAERAVHLNAAEIGILAAIPIIVIIAILMLAVSIIARNRE